MNLDKTLTLSLVLLVVGAALAYFSRSTDPINGGAATLSIIFIIAAVTIAAERFFRKK